MLKILGVEFYYPQYRRLVPACAGAISRSISTHHGTVAVSTHHMAIAISTAYLKG